MGIELEITPAQGIELRQNLEAAQHGEVYSGYWVDIRNPNSQVHQLKWFEDQLERANIEIDTSRLVADNGGCILS